MGGGGYWVRKDVLASIRYMYSRPWFGAGRYPFEEFYSTWEAHVRGSVEATREEVRAACRALRVLRAEGTPEEYVVKLW